MPYNLPNDWLNQAWLTSKGLSFRQLFWLTGFLAFFISPVADKSVNLNPFQVSHDLNKSYAESDEHSYDEVFLLTPLNKSP
jgi:hypothetical protein